MYTILVLIATIISVLLIVMVLLQSSKGGGLAGTFGGAANMGAMFGTRRTADFLSKGTWWLAGALAIIAIVVNLFFLPGQSTPQQRSVIQEGSRTTVPTAPTLPQQNQTQPPANNNQ